MFVWPNGTVTGSVNWAELERLVAERDDETVTEDGWAALDALVTEHVGATAPSEAGGEPDDSYESMTVLQLQEQLRLRGLPVSGNKAELVERLTYDDSVGPTPEPEADEEE